MFGRLLLRLCQHSMTKARRMLPSVLSDVSLKVNYPVCRSGFSIIKESSYTLVTRSPSTTEVTGTTSACVLSQWQQWSTCPAECQYGRTRSRTRSVISGQCDQSLLDTDSCSDVSCEECTITREKYRQQLDREPPSDGKLK